MTGFVRLRVLLFVVLTVVTVGCGKPDSTKMKSDNNRLLKAGSITRTASASPKDEVYLFQTEAEVKTRTQQYGPVPIDGVDFSRHTVAVLVRRYRPFEPMIKAVEVIEKTARVVLADNPSKPNPIPGLPAGLEVCQYVVLQIPKVDAIEVIEAKPGP